MSCSCSSAPTCTRTPSRSIQGKAELIIAKQRNGPTCSIELAFLKQHTRFEIFLAGGYQRGPANSGRPPASRSGMCHDWQSKSSGGLLRVNRPTRSSGVPCISLRPHWGRLPYPRWCKTLLSLFISRPKEQLLPSLYPLFAQPSPTSTLPAIELLFGAITAFLARSRPRRRRSSRSSRRNPGTRPRRPSPSRSRSSRRARRMLACADIEEAIALRAAGVRAGILVFGALSVSDSRPPVPPPPHPRTISTPTAARAVEAEAGAARDAHRLSPED